MSSVFFTTFSSVACALSLAGTAYSQADGAKVPAFTEPDPVQVEGQDAGRRLLAKHHPDEGFTGRFTTLFDLRYRYEMVGTRDFSEEMDSNHFEHIGRLRIGGVYEEDNWSATVWIQQVWNARIRDGELANHAALVFDRGFLDIRDGDWTLRLGRHPLAFGDSRQLADPQWGNYGITWDGFRLISEAGPTRTDLFYARAGSVLSRVTHPAIAGIHVNHEFSEALETDAYAFYKSESRADGDQRLWSFGVRPQMEIAPGLEGSVEYAVQRGRIGARDKDASASVATLEYAPEAWGGLSLFIERAHATGGTPESARDNDYTMLYASMFGRYSRVGVMGWSNSEIWSLKARYRGLGDLDLLLSYSTISLANAAGFWFANGGLPVKGADGNPLRDPTGGSGRHAGHEISLHATYPLTEEMDLQGGFAVFHPGEFVRRTNQGQADARTLFYLQFRYRF